MPQRGDILLYSGTGLISMAIRFTTGSPWSHCAWVLDGERILESDWELFGSHGVIISPISRYDKSKVRFVRPKIDPKRIEWALGFAMRQIGKRYDLKLLGGLLWSYLRGRVTGTRALTSGRNRAWICSELVATPLWRASGFRFRDDIPVVDIVPGDVWDAVQLGRCEIVE